MSRTAILRQFIPDITRHAISVAAVVMDAVDEGLSLIFVAPKTTTIRYMDFFIQTTTPGVLRAGICALGADGHPNYVWYGATNNGFVDVSITSGDSNTWKMDNLLTEDVSIVQGQVYAAVVYIQAFTGQSLSVRNSANICNDNRICRDAYYALAWSKLNTHTPTYVLKKSDKTPIPVGGGYAVLRNVTTSTPNERGNLFRLDAAISATGISAVIDNDAAFVLRLYRVSDGAELAICTVGAEQAAYRASNALAWSTYLFDSVTVVDLAAGIDYIIACQSTVATIGTVYYRAGTALQLGYLGMAGKCSACYRDYGGAWSYDTTERNALFLMCDYQPDPVLPAHRRRYHNPSMAPLARRGIN